MTHTSHASLLPLSWGRSVERATAAFVISASLAACSGNANKTNVGPQLAAPANSSAGSSTATTTMAGRSASVSMGAAVAGAAAGASAAIGSGSAGTGTGSSSSRAGAGASATVDAGSPTASVDSGSPAVGAADGGDVSAGGACTREVLAAAVDSYYKALSAHDAKLLNASASIKLTEDGKTIMLGEGLMKTAGMVKFKRSGLDTVQCETVTESVVENNGNDYVVGTRLKLAAAQVTEIESILVGPNGWYPNPKAIIDSSSDDWEKPLLAESDRWSRDKLKKDIVDGYFLGVFGGKIKVADFPFASDCKRSENGFSPGACSFGVPTTMPMTPLHYVVDVEAGIVAGFVLFGGKSSGMDDFHMFHVKAGKVAAVHAVVGPSVMGRGWPSDPAGMP
jgi:hypothetical protein